MPRMLSCLALLLLVAATPRPAGAIFASPIHAGCYIAAPNDCRIHVDPVTVNIASGTKLLLMRMVVINQTTFVQTTAYDWRGDQSNPPPVVGTTYAPTIPGQDLGAQCGKSYEVSLQGQDSGDGSVFNLGLTAPFTCPAGLP